MAKPTKRKTQQAPSPSTPYIAMQKGVTNPVEVPLRECEGIVILLGKTRVGLVAKGDHLGVVSEPGTILSFRMDSPRHLIVQPHKE